MTQEKLKLVCFYVLTIFHMEPSRMEQVRLQFVAFGCNCT